MDIVLIAHNIRSAHNVGALFRTADGMGVARLILSGYTPHPHLGPDDPRLPHIAARLTTQIHKTALGAEATVPFVYQPTPDLAGLRAQGYRIVGLEQDARAIALPDYRPTGPVALLLGEEVAGIAPDLRTQCDDLIEIPMYGHKESFNVSVAAGIALYGLRQAYTPGGAPDTPGPAVP